MRAEGREVPLPTFQAVAQADPLNRRVVEQMLVGVATRHYARSLESVPAGVVSRGTSKSSVSRRFVAKTTAQLRAWQSTPLDRLDLVALLLDGVHLGEHCLVVALGIAADGQKHALGLWEGATETPRCVRACWRCRAGACAPTGACSYLDGAGPAQRRGRSSARLIQGPQAPQHPGPPAGAAAAVGAGDRATRLSATDVKTATRLLTDLERLDEAYPSAAGSVREGLEETLTVLTLHLSARLQRSLATTNAAESLLSRTRHVKRNVTRWRGGQMMLRWVAAGVLEAVKGFRRLKGCDDMPRLVTALRARDQRLRLGVSEQKVA